MGMLKSTAVNISWASKAVLDAIRSKRQWLAKTALENAIDEFAKAEGLDPEKIRSDYEKAAGRKPAKAGNVR